MAQQYDTLQVDTLPNYSTKMLLHFDNPGGAIIDSSLYGFSTFGTVTMTQFSGDEYPIYEKFDDFIYAATVSEFAGIGWANVPTRILPHSGNWTHEFHFYPVIAGEFTGSGNNHVLSMGTGNNPSDYQFRIYVDNAGIWGGPGNDELSISLKLADGTEVYAPFDSNPTVGQYNHIAIERHNGTINLYLNYVKQTTTISLSGQDLYVGNHTDWYLNRGAGGYNGFTSFYDEYRISNDAIYQGAATIDEHTEAFTTELPQDPQTVDYDDFDVFPPVSVLTTGVDELLTITRTASGVVSAGQVAILNDNNTVSLAGKRPTDLDLISETISGATQGNAFLTYHDTSNHFLAFYSPDDDANKHNIMIPTTLSGNAIVYGVENEWYTGALDLSVQQSFYIPELGYTLMHAYDSPSITHYATLVTTIPHASDRTLDDSSFGNLLSFSVDYPNHDFIYDSGNDIFINVQGASGVSNKHVSKVIGRSGTTLSVHQSFYYAGAPGNPSLYPRVLYDSTSGKHLVLYCNTAASKQLYSNFGTVTMTPGVPSGATIAYSGSTLELSTTLVSDVTYSSDHDRLVIIYDTGTTNQYSRVGQIDWDAESITWSGTTSDLTVDSGNHPNRQLFHYNPDTQMFNYFGWVNNRTVTTGRMNSDLDAIRWYSTEIIDSTSSNGFYFPYSTVDDGYLYGRFVDSTDILSIYTLDIYASNLTSNNIIGIAQNTAQDGESSIIGRYAFIDEQQTGLTIGSTYYYNDWNELTTTETSYLVGLALTNTKLLVKA